MSARAVPLALLTVAFLAGPASAECAWVLWWEGTTSTFSYRTADGKTSGSKFDQEEKSSWNIIGSYPKNATCESQQAQKIGFMLTVWRKDKSKSEAAGGEHVVNHEPGSNIISKRSTWVGEHTASFAETIRYLCLPDTVDPRGPKGK